MHENEKSKWSHLVVSDSMRPHGLQPTGSSVHGIFQARVLEWGAIGLCCGEVKHQNIRGGTQESVSHPKSSAASSWRYGLDFAGCLDLLVRKVIKRTWPSVGPQDAPWKMEALPAVPSEYVLTPAGAVFKESAFPEQCFIEAVWLVWQLNPAKASPLTNF